MSLTNPVGASPETVEAIGYENDDGTLYGYANHKAFEGNPGGIPVRIIRESDYQALRSALTAREQQHQQALEYVADLSRKDTGAIGPRWWCLRDDLKKAAVKVAMRLINEWADEEARIAAKYGKEIP